MQRRAARSWALCGGLADRGPGVETIFARRVIRPAFQPVVSALTQTDRRLTALHGQRRLAADLGAMIRTTLSVYDPRHTRFTKCPSRISHAVWRHHGRECVPLLNANTSPLTVSA